MKALELAIYERDEDGYYVDARGWLYVDADVEVYADIKRFADAELAAEYWVTHWASEFAALNGFYSVSEQWTRQADILERFATLPHYDEQP